MSVETYTAKRAYQIASEYRRRGVPVVMGGFHPTLVPDETSEYAESIVVGEAEGLWPEVIEAVLGRTPRMRFEKMDDVLTADAEARKAFPVVDRIIRGQGNLLMSVNVQLQDGKWMPVLPGQ